MRIFNHINDIYEEFKKCKDIDDIEELIGEIPRVFGDFYYEILNEDTFRITNTYEEFGDWQEEEVDFDFYK